MLPKKKLQDVFDDDPFGLLNVKATPSAARNADERLLASFQEILSFFEANGREPQPGGGIQEHQLYSRLKGIRENAEKKEMLNAYDKHSLLNYETKQIASLSDILNDDSFGLLEDSAEGLYDFKHVPREDERASADFVARRKPCKDFDKYEATFKEVQKDLANQNRVLVSFKQDNLRPGEFYVHNGVLLLLENVDFEESVQEFKSGSRIRKDGRTRVIFENGTESNMLYRSLYKGLLDNGKAISRNEESIHEQFVEKFNTVNEEDVETGYIYVLQSKSEREEIRSIQNLYKIGYSKIPVEQRIKNARQEPTFLMADVKLITAFKCYNINTQKLEQLLHNFFGAACLEIDITGNDGLRYRPREWFVAPLNVLEQAITLIQSKEIINYRYDSNTSKIRPI